jgi:iron-sulfur cluster repair protein YtfE (RIC family)
VAEGLADAFEEHLSGEERILFPAIRDLVPRDAQNVVIEELRARRRFAHRSPDASL